MRNPNGINSESTRPCWCRSVVVALTVAAFVLRPIGLPAQSQAASSQSAARTGLAIEYVRFGYEGQQADLRVGDVILSYSGKLGTTSIESPFQWDGLEAKSTERLPLTLRGLRRTEEMVWTLKAPGWGVRVRPLLREEIDAAYRRCHDLASAGKNAEALQCWPTVIRQVRTTDPLWVPAWLAEQTLLTLSNKPDWKEAKEVLPRLIEQIQAAGMGQPATAEFFAGVGLVSEFRNDLKEAEDYYRRALAAWESVISGSIGAARVLNMLGSLALQSGDPAQAIEHYSRARSITERLAPAGEDAATTLNGLASAAERRSEWTKALAYYRSALTIRTRLSPGSLELAEILFNSGGPAFRLGDLTGAEEYYSQALAIRERMRPDSTDVADCLHMLGMVMNVRGMPGKAENYHRQALTIYQRSLPESLSAARTITALGTDFMDLGDLDKAKTFYDRSLAIQAESAPGSSDLAITLGQLGNLALTRGDLAGADKYYQQALAIQTDGTSDFALTLGNLGLLAQDRGDMEKADLYYHRALAINENLAPESLDTAQSLRNVGQLARDRGELDIAEDYYHRSLTIVERISPGSIEFARTLQTLGHVALKRLDLSTAESYYRQALAIYTKLVPESHSAADCFNDLGNIALNRDDLAKAESNYQESLRISTRIAPDSALIAPALGNLGAVAAMRRDTRKAEDYYRRALAINRISAPRSVAIGMTLLGLGDAVREEGNPGEAEDHYREGIAIIEAVAPDTDIHSRLLNALGLILFRNGRFEESVRYFDGALRALEKQTARLGGTQESRTGFRSRFLGYYNNYIRALVTLKQPEKAFQILERAHGRQFLSVVAERDLLFTGGVSSEIQRARRLNAAAYDNLQAQLSKLSAGKNGVETEQLLARMRELQTERDQIRERTRRMSPRFAALEYPEPLAISDARSLLDAGTALLSFSVGQDDTVLFVIRPAGEEPGVSTYTFPIGEELLRKRVETIRKLILERKGATDVKFVSESRRLYTALLAPAESAFATSDRLLLAPDGPLSSLPFSALLRARNQYLLEWKPVHTVVSATVYAQLIKQRRNAPKPVELVAFGDPRYAIGRREGVERRTSAAALVANRGLMISPLLFSRAEVDGITSLFPTRSRKFLGVEATETRAKSIGTDVRYIHFAVHGILDDRFPLDSALALTIPEKTLEGQDNGLLQAWEVMEQMRIDADLVTLSACNTGMGYELNGDGLIGLTRAFQYAGAHSVVASFWAVDDLRTMELMKQFYTALRAGRTKDEALRAAQLVILRATPTSSPFYWAAFSLNGDWR